MLPEATPDSHVAQGAALDLAVVVPTYKERDNVALLFQRLDRVLAGKRWELLFVDDNSPDGTADAVRALAKHDSRVRLIRRIGRRGLASASIEGMMATTASFVAVMDADLQHDETILPEMLDRIEREGLDLVIASRHGQGASMGQFAAQRVRLSNLGARIGNAVTGCELSDPMSGFFVVSQRFLDQVAPRLSGVGFKILLDIVASAKGKVRFAEVPYTFRQRQHGESKLDVAVGAEYIYLLIDKLIGDLFPPQFAVYTVVGSLGVAIHLLFLRAFYRGLGLPFSESQSLATAIVIAINFLLNNRFTFRERRLRGVRLLRGLLIYALGCAIGLLTNVGVARFLQNAGAPWYLAGIFGLAVSAVWNYWVSSVFTWRKRLPQ
ncbi:MAG TPA: glycosyltransferase family 2 protein [Bryobacteraceae bacterium]|jgi:dolichol-phosphate mannosyltransferase|nr:glycosyltransferase family 2 protein [Bryobacteraceae bacterium]